MKAEILTVGDELLLGQVVDSNSAYLGARLAEVGVEVVRLTSVGDSELAIVGALQDALRRVDLVVMSGGLGPTEDDRTKSALSAGFQRKLVFHQELLDLIQERYAKRGVVMADNVRNQAFQPEGAILLQNPLGSAVGIMIEHAHRWVIALPGVPRELEAITEQSVLPFIRQINPGHAVVFRNILTYGAFESKLAEMLEAAKFTHAGCDLAYLPSYRGVILRLTYQGPSQSGGEELIARQADVLKAIVTDYFISDDGRDLAEVVADLLKAGGKTVAVAESCTGGMLAARLTDIPGSSAYFLRGVVTYSNEAKTELLGVPESVLISQGAVSEETARIMAGAVRRSAAADFGIAITGIAGPTGGTSEKPVGLVYIGVADAHGVEVRRHNFGVDRAINRQRAVYAALNHLRLKLL